MNVDRNREIVITVRVTDDEFAIINTFLGIAGQDEAAWEELEEWINNSTDDFSNTIHPDTARDIVEKFIRDF